MTTALDEPLIADVPVAGTVLGSKYLLGNLLGEGAYAWVFEARHHAIDSLRFAVKVLKPAYSRRADIGERFERVAASLSALQGRHCVRVFDAGTSDDGLRYIAMERVRGLPLHETLRLNGALSPLAVATLSTGIARALLDGHAHGLIHRDVKPSNVLVTQPSGDPHPIAKVLDFGVLEILGGDAHFASDDLPRIDAPRYAAPELIEGRPLASSDFYALGLLMIEMLTGKPALQHDNPIVLAARQLSPEPIPIADEVREGPLGEIISRLVAKDPAERYPDASALVVDLGVCSEDLASDEGSERFRLDLGDGLPDPEEFAARSMHSDAYDLVSEDEDPFVPEETGTDWAAEGTPAAPIDLAAAPRGGTLDVPDEVRARIDAADDEDVPARSRVVPIAVAAVAAVLLAVGAWVLFGGDAAAPPAPVAVAPAAVERETPAAALPPVEPSAPADTPDDAAAALAAALETVHGAASPDPDELLTLLGEPAGAIVTIDDRPVGTLPLRDAFVGRDRPLTVVVLADGYEPLELLFDAPGPLESRVALAPLAEEPAAQEREREPRRVERSPTPSAGRDASRDRETEPREREAEPRERPAPPPPAPTAAPAPAPEPERAPEPVRTQPPEQPALRHSDIRNPWGD